jgi:hypothetical protein
MDESQEGSGKGARVAQTLTYGTSLFIEMKGGAHFRRAHVYRVANSEPEVWRIRAEKFPEHCNAGTGWFGGRVLWGHDQAVREDAEAIAKVWVADGVLPYSG